MWLTKPQVFRSSLYRKRLPPHLSLKDSTLALSPPIPLPAQGKKSPAIQRAFSPRACVLLLPDNTPGIPSPNSLSPPPGLTQASEEAKGSCLQGDRTDPGHASWVVHKCVWGGLNNKSRDGKRRDQPGCCTCAFGLGPTSVSSLLLRW